MQVLLRPVANKYLERLNESDNSRIKAALYDLSKEPPEGGHKAIVRTSGLLSGKSRKVQGTIPL